MNDLSQSLNTQGKKADELELEALFKQIKLVQGSTLQEKINDCRKENPHWNYSRIARLIGCSHTTVRIALDDEAAAKVAQARRAKRKEMEIADPSMHIPKSAKRKFRLGVEVKLDWYLRKLIRETIPCFHRKQYISKSFDACTHLSLIRSKLEAQFREGMTWRTLGKFWMIGFRVDPFEFDLNELLQQRMALHWSNLVPVKIGKRLKYLEASRVQQELARLYNQLRNEDYYRGNTNTHEFEPWEQSPYATKPPWGHRGELPNVTTFFGPNKDLEVERGKNICRIRRRKRLAILKQCGKTSILKKSPELEVHTGESSSDLVLCS